MSRHGFPVLRGRSPEAFGERYCRMRTESQLAAASDTAPLPLSVDNLSDEALYAAICPNDGEVLPPGWEKVVFHGAVVYLDHVAREAHEVRPWEVWRQRFEAAK